MDGLGYAITKSAPESRYTFGPLYAPDRADAHGEWTDADTLQKATWDYVRASSKQGRQIQLQHGDHGDIQVGEWVECVAWPYPSTVTVTKAGEAPRKMTLPAGTVYLGVIWSPEAWQLIKSGKLNGLSLGGRAQRVPTPGLSLARMGDAKTAAVKKFANLLSRSERNYGLEEEQALAAAEKARHENRHQATGRYVVSDTCPVCGKKKSDCTCGEEETGDAAATGGNAAQMSQSLFRSANARAYRRIW